jgi:hypothetical protein
MRVGKRTRLGVTLMLVAGAATLILGCKGTRKQASVAEAPPDGATQQATLKAPPIPEAGPLALPKSLRQAPRRDSRGDTARQSADP